MFFVFLSLEHRVEEGFPLCSVIVFPGAKGLVLIVCSYCEILAVQYCIRFEAVCSWLNEASPSDGPAN